MLSRQVPPTSSAFSNRANESMPASCNLAAMHRPDMPAPIIATFTGRFCLMAATCPLAGLTLRRRR